MKPLRLLALLLFLNQYAYLQVSGTDFKPGIYLSVADFRENSPLRSDQVADKRDNLFALLKAGKNATINHRDSIFDISSKSVWGYADGKSVYISKSHLPQELFQVREFSESKFAEINIIGKISLIYFMRTYQDNFAIIKSKALNSSTKMAEILLDVETGEIKSLSRAHLSTILNDDYEFLARLQKLTTRDFKKNKEKVYELISDYNKKHFVFEM